MHLARALNVAGPVTLQPQYSLLAREIEWEIVPAAIDAGLGLLPWSPLGGGWLSGKYRRDQRPTGATRLGDDPNRGMEAYDRRGTRAHLARHRRGAEGGRGPRRVHGRGRAGLGDRPARGQLDHPGRPHGRLWAAGLNGPLFPRAIRLRVVPQRSKRLIRWALPSVRASGRG